MSHEHLYALGELDRRLANIVRHGSVAAIDYGAARVQVDLGEFVTDWLPWLTPRAGLDQVWTTPDVGEQVTVLSNGDPSQGVVIGSLFQDAHPQNGNAGKDRRVTFSDGSVVEFDRQASALNVQVNAAGSVRLNIGGTTLLLKDGQATLTTPLFLVDAPQSTFTGSVEIDGSMVTKGDATVNGSTSLQGVTSRGTNVGSTHTHPDPQGGSTGGPQ